MTKLISGRVKKIPSANVSASRYEFIKLSETEPDLGLPAGNGYVLASNVNGLRTWIVPVTEQRVANLISTVKANIDLNSINEDDLTACNKIRIDIDNVFKNQLERLYNAVQYFRQRVHDEIGNRSKFGVVWSASAQNIINQYLPGKTFDNYLPETD